jgi:hypothetical protein
MTQQPTTENQKGFLQDDRKLVCSMLVVYSLCIFGCIAAVFWSLNSRRLTLSNNATSTAVAIATQQANVTATLSARMTEQAQYKVVDDFSDNEMDWLTETVRDEFMDGSLGIYNGSYVWNIEKLKQPFIYWANLRGVYGAEDFDVYVDSKITPAASGEVCSGFVFRTASSDWEEGGYTFSVCNNSYFDVSYYEKGEWTAISDLIYSTSSLREDWNRLEIIARGNHFTFFVNNEEVYEMTDDRLQRGGLALLIEVSDVDSATIRFDNFGFQSR